MLCVRDRLQILSVLASLVKDCGESQLSYKIPRSGVVYRVKMCPGTIANKQVKRSSRINLLSSYLLT